MYIFGASGHGKVIMDILLDSGSPFHGFLDDNKAISFVGEVPVIHDDSFLTAHDTLVIGVGNNAIREKLASRWKVMFGKAIHPSVIQSASVEIDEGTVVMQGAILQANVKLGRHVIVNTAASVDHDCIVEDFVHIAPGCRLCGNVRIGRGSLLGVGTVVIPGIKIGKNCVIGAGSVVVSDIPDGVKVYGNPAKVISNI